MSRLSQALIFLAILVYSRPFAAQPASRTGQYSISGVVVNAITGAPLDRAEVTLQTTTEGKQVAQTTTAEDGHFAFNHLPAAKYALLASRRGYISSSFDEHSYYSTAIVTGEGLVSNGLTFRLPPQAIISGTVTDDSGDPVEQASVILYRQDMQNGIGNIVRVNQATSDDQGDYELARLEPGNYYIAVSAKPWYITTIVDRTAQGSIPSHGALDVAYATTFYPDTTDSSAATPIPVKAGDRLSINFSMHAVPALHLTVQLPRVNGAETNAGFAVPVLQQEIFGSRQAVATGVSYFVGSAGGGPPDTVEIGGIAPGDYQVQLPASDRVSALGRIANVNATSDLKLDPSQASPLAEVTGKLAMASGEKLPAGLRVSLRSGEGETASAARADQDGSFTLHGIAPGSYTLVAVAQSTSLAVTQMAASGASVEGQLLTVSSQPVTLAATLVAGATTITGFAVRRPAVSGGSPPGAGTAGGSTADSAAGGAPTTAESAAVLASRGLPTSGVPGPTVSRVKAPAVGVPAAGVMVLLVPDNLPGGHPPDPELFRRDQSDSDGSFVLNRVIPGDYILLAIEDGWTLEWARPGALTPYLAQGQKLRVPSQTKRLGLPTPIAVQPK